MMNYFRIATLASRIKDTPSEETELKHLLTALRTPEAQQAFFDYCERWKLAPWLYTQLQRKKLLGLFSEKIQQAFAQRHENVMRQNENRNREALQFLKAFCGQGIEVAVLKGNAFAHSVYHDTGYKRMNDFDILIHKQDWDRVQEIYFSLGYIPLGFGWSGEKQAAAKFSHVGMSFISPGFSCIVGTQWGLKSPTAGYAVNIEEAWQTACDFDFYGLPLKQLSPEYNLLHLVLHMGIYKCGIRDCMDVYNLLLAEKLDEEKFIRMVQQGRAVDKTLFTLKLCNLCGQNLDHLIRKLEPGASSFITKRLNKRLNVYARSGDFQDSYNDYFQDIEKVVIYFNLFPQFHKKLYLYLKILKLIFIPKMVLALQLIDKPGSASVRDRAEARLTAPYYVFALIACEIGRQFTLLLFVKLIVDLFGSLKNYLVKKDSYFDYLEKRGVEAAAIEKAVKNIQ